MFTYHIHDLHEGEAEVNGESLRVIGNWPLQWVVVSHQVPVQSALVCPLKRNYRTQRNLDSKYTFIITSEREEQDRLCKSHLLPINVQFHCQTPFYTAILQHKQHFFLEYTELNSCLRLHPAQCMSYITVKVPFSSESKSSLSGINRERAE